MTREEQIIEAGAYNSCGRRPPKTCGHNMHELAYINRNLAFEAGAKWADEHPNPEIIKRVFLYALQHTNILLADDWDEVRWDLLIKKAMEK